MADSLKTLRSFLTKFLFYRFVESGLIQYWISHNDLLMIHFFDNQANHSSENRALTLEDITGGFTVLAIGLVISLISFLIEIFVKNVF